MFVQKRPHPGRSRVVPLAILLGLTLGIACAGTPSEGPPAPPIASADDYRISPGDELRILIYPDPPVDRLVKVRDDGRVSIDLIGDLDVAGCSTMPPCFHSCSGNNWISPKRVPPCWTATMCDRSGVKFARPTPQGNTYVLSCFGLSATLHNSTASS
jgi:hypothetical protein